MLFDVVLAITIGAIFIVGYFLYKALPKLLHGIEAAATGKSTPHHDFYLLEHRLHETESHEAARRTAPFPGAWATFAAAQDHFAVADAYHNEWNKRFAWEPPAKPRDLGEFEEAAATPPPAPAATTAGPVATAAAMAGPAAAPTTPAGTAVAGEVEGETIPVIVVTETIVETIIVPTEAEGGEERAA
jgi:hypothetical protein